jgi:hypothetical protein
MVRLSVAQLLPAMNGGGVERGTLEVARELVAARPSLHGNFRRWAAGSGTASKRW